MGKRQWYRIGPGCEADGLVAGTTIEGVRLLQTKVLKDRFELPDGTVHRGAPPIVPDEWFGFDDAGENIKALFLRKEIIVPYEPIQSELDFAYDVMFPGLKPAPAPKRSSRSKKQDETESDESDDIAETPIEDNEVKNDGE